MKRTIPASAAKRAFSALLLAVAPFLLVAGLRPHIGHPPDRSTTPVFADASHAGEANHLEAADSVRFSRCDACLTPVQLQGLAPVAWRGQTGIAARWASTPATACSPSSGALGAQRPRAPPSS